MHIEFPHKLADDEARERLVALGEYLTNRHGIAVTWNGDKASFNGKYLVVRIEGELSTSPGMVVCKGRDPGFLWRRKATDYLKGKLEKYLDPENPVDSLPRR